MFRKVGQFRTLSTASILHSVSGRMQVEKEAANRVEATRRLRQFEENSKTKMRISNAIHQCW
jgi:hypothetical protein